MELLKIRSFEKQQEILNILHSEKPDHYSRIYLVGFLHYVGYTQDDILEIIDKEAAWMGYDATKTFNQVRSIINPRNTHHISLQFREEAATAETPLQRGFVECTIQNTHITCYFRKCGKCPIKVIS